MLDLEAIKRRVEEDASSGTWRGSMWKARQVCDAMSVNMRGMGVITTAHYDGGLQLIADAITEAISQVSADRDSLIDALEAARRENHDLRNELNAATLRAAEIEADEPGVMCLGTPESLLRQMEEEEGEPEELSPLGAEMVSGLESFADHLEGGKTVEKWPGASLKLQDGRFIARIWPDKDGYIAWIVAEVEGGIARIRASGAEESKSEAAEAAETALRGLASAPVVPTAESIRPVDRGEQATRERGE